MTSLHLTIDLADMTQALRDSFDVDDIAREMLDLVDTPTAEDVAPEVDLKALAGHIDLVELAKRLTPELYSNSLRDLHTRVRRLEALVSKVSAFLAEPDEDLRRDERRAMLPETPEGIRDLARPDEV